MSYRSHLQSLHNTQPYHAKQTFFQHYKESLQDQIRDIAKQAIALIDDKLCKPTTAKEKQLFYQIRKGDFYRFMTDFSEGVERSTFLEQCKEAYKCGNDIVFQLKDENFMVWPPTFDGTHPLALALALNEAILYSDVLNDYGKAMEIYQTALFGAESSENVMSSASWEPLERSREYLEEYKRVKELLEGNIEDLHQEYFTDGEFVLPLYPEDDSDLGLDITVDSYDEINHDYVNFAILSPSIVDVENTTNDLSMLIADIGARVSDLRQEVLDLDATQNSERYLDSSPMGSEGNLNVADDDDSNRSTSDGWPENWDIIL